MTVGTRRMLLIVMRAVESASTLVLKTAAALAPRHGGSGQAEYDAGR